MTYIEGFIAAVPIANKDAYVDYANGFAPMIRELGATRMVQCWSDDVPEGKVTDFRKSVNGMAAPISFIRGSLIIFSFAASRAVRSGYSNQEKTTASSSFAWTDLRKSVTLPSGTSSLQLST